MRSIKADVEIEEDLEAVSRKAAEVIAGHVFRTLQTGARFSIALSGGSTPRRLYELLADRRYYGRRLPWHQLHFFWGDERHVSPDHPASNFRMVQEAMLSKVSVPPQNIHRVPTEYPEAGQVAKAYEQDLYAFFQPEGGQLPCFDCVLLGLGPDGHTASLFPGTTALNEADRLVVANWVEKFQTYRITMTLPVLNNATCIIFLVSGAEKAMTLKNVLEGAEQPDRLPAQLIRPKQGKLIWMIDRPAARRLNRAK